MRLTDLLIRKLRAPEKGQKTYFDETNRGFGVRVSQGGSKSFVVMFGRRRQLKTLGRYPDVSLADARKEAKRVQAEENQSTGKQPRISITFFEAREKFLHDAATRNKPRTVKDYRRQLNLHFNFEADLHDVTAPDIMAVLEPLRDTPSEQEHAFVALRTMMNWCVKRNILERSPMPALTFKKQSRDRILTDQELITVWQRAEEVSYPYGSIIQLLILTGQRRGEIAALRRSWIADNAITFPTGFTKNKREHRLPLEQHALQLIDDLPNTGDLLFPSRYDESKTFNGWGKAKAQFDAPLKLPPYTLHDLRRTYSSNLARLGVPIHVTEKLLNHASGTITGVAAVYNRYSYQEEMREVVTQHERFLVGLITKQNQV
ncbi:MAG: site-specific integrase [Hyphomicrobiaceae bacterium]